MLAINDDDIYSLDIRIESPMVAAHSDLGKLIHDRRRALGLTQEQVSEMAGIRQHYVSQIERGKVRQPGDDILLPLARALELQISDVRRAMGWVVIEAPMRIVEGVMLPVRGRVPADTIRFTTGQDGASMDEIEVAPSDIADARSPYALEVSGDCLQAVGILSGDVVIVEPAEGRAPRHRQIVVVRIGDEVTLKRWVVNGDEVELQDGDESVVHRIRRDSRDDVDVLAFYVTFKPLAPR